MKTSTEFCESPVFRIFGWRINHSRVVSIEADEEIPVKASKLRQTRHRLEQLLQLVLCIWLMEWQRSRTNKVTKNAVDVLV